MRMIPQEHQFVHASVIRSAEERIAFVKIVLIGVILARLIQRLMVPGGKLRNLLRCLFIIAEHISKMFLLVVVSDRVALDRLKSVTN